MTTANNQQITGWVGWVGLAATLMAVSGILHILFGLGGVFGQDWYITTTNAAWLFDSSAWGWSMIAGGAFLAVTAYLLMRGNMVGRVIGIVLATISLFVNIALFAAAPIWSTLLIFMDLAILYAIIAHGSEMKQLDDR